MSIENPNIVDAAGVDKDGEVVLTISDHLDWESVEHIPALRDKIGAYLSFVESGQVVELYPDAKGRPVRIDVVCKFHPNAAAEQFFASAMSVLGDVGLSLSWRVVAQQELQADADAPRGLI